MSCNSCRDLDLCRDPFITPAEGNNPYVKTAIFGLFDTCQHEYVHLGTDNIVSPDVYITLLIGLHRLKHFHSLTGYLTARNQVLKGAGTPGVKELGTLWEVRSGIPKLARSGRN